MNRWGLSKIFEGESFYDNESVEILKKILLIEGNKERGEEML